MYYHARLYVSSGDSIKSSHFHGKGKQVHYPLSHLPSSSPISSQLEETGEQEKNQQEFMAKCMPYMWDSLGVKNSQRSAQTRKRTLDSQGWNLVGKGGLVAEALPYGTL